MNADGEPITGFVDVPDPVLFPLLNDETDAPRLCVGSGGTAAPDAAEPRRNIVPVAVESERKIRGH